MAKVKSKLYRQHG